jgi:hypothetical protein
VSNVIALFGLNAGARRAATGMTQWRVLEILRGEIPSGRCSSRVSRGPARGVEAARRRSAYAPSMADEIERGMGDEVTAGQIRALRETPLAMREIAL